MSTKPIIFTSTPGVAHLCTVKGAPCQRAWQRSRSALTACQTSAHQSVHYHRSKSIFRQRLSSTSFGIENSFIGQSVRQRFRSGTRRKDLSLENGQRRAQSVRASIGPELGSADFDVVGALGLDTLTFLAATVIVVPTFRSFKISPILGFLLSGVALNELGLIRNIEDVKALSELGILFLLFEMGLELSLERLQALAKFAFGIGLPQVILTTLAFAAFELPPNNAIGTRLLEFFFGAKPDLVNIRSIDEALVIGAALSLSSSAFVLQLLSEKGELATRFGSATLGILLLQDIVVVPLLVILPILESGDFTDDSLFPLLAAAGLKSLLGLGVLLFMGRLFLRRFFEFVAESRSSEAFVALCLLTVTGTAQITSKLGFSDSLGAFLAGALLAETNYRTQVEADIRPFRGLLLGLFFVTTGTSIDIELLFDQWPNILAMVAGLIGIKAAIISLLGPRAGLSLPESVRTGLLLSQGGEFAFVVFALANQLGVLPEELNRLLIIVVVLSMAITPALDSLGRRGAEWLETYLEEQAAMKAATNGALAVGGAGGGRGGGAAWGDAGYLSDSETGELQGAGGGSGRKAGGGSHGNFEGAEPIVILGFNQMGQVLANFLSTPLASGSASDAAGWPFVCFDLNPKRVRLGKKLGFPVLYGDASRAAVLQSAGIVRPKAVLIVYSSRQRSVEAVEKLRDSFPGVPIYARAVDLAHLAELRHAGAEDVVLETAETSLRLGSMLLQRLGVMRDDVVFLRQLMRDAMEQRAKDSATTAVVMAQVAPALPQAAELTPDRTAATATAIALPSASAPAQAVEASASKTVEKGLLEQGFTSETDTEGTQAGRGEKQAAAAAVVGAVVGGVAAAAAAIGGGGGGGVGAAVSKAAGASAAAFVPAVAESNNASGSTSRSAGKGEKEEECGEDMECFADPDDEDGEVTECVDTTVEFAGTVSGTVLMKVSSANAALEAAESPAPFIFGGSAAASVAAAVAAGMDLPDSSKEAALEKFTNEEEIVGRTVETAVKSEVLAEMSDAIGVEGGEVNEVVETIEEKILAPEGAFEYFSDGEDFVDTTIVPQTRSKF